MVKVRDLMTTDLVVVSPRATFREVVSLMLDNDVSGLPVVTGDNRLAGIVTEADLLPKEAFGPARRRVLRVIADLLAGAGPSLLAQAEAQTAAELMTAQVIVAHPEEDARDAAARMLERGVKRLPVVDDGRVIGIVSRADLLRVLRSSDIAASSEGPT